MTSKFDKRGRATPMTKFCILIMVDVVLMPPPLLGIFGRLKPSEVLTPSISWAASKKLFLAEEGCGGRRPSTGHIVVLTAADRGGAYSKARLSGP